MNGQVLLLCALVASGCATGGTERISQVKAARDGDLELLCEPAQARVVIDGVERGRCEDFRTRTLRLGQGMHRVEVNQQGMSPFQTFVDPSGTRARIQVALVPLTKG